MENISEFAELLFFDTFAHDNTEEINLDLVQFPKPVYVTEVRIIPLGARVQADFPGGVRLGATNPSQFKIEFFVNDLGKPGASAFETLGGFEYNQNGCINLDCAPNDTIRKIPTDGLVLRGWYTTITLAVYGTLTKNIAEQIIQPVVNPPVVPSQPNLVEPQQVLTGNHLETEWPTENISMPVEYEQPTQAYQQTYTQPETYQQEYQDYYNDPPKDPRSYHVENTEWNKVCQRSSEGDRDRSRDMMYEKTGNIERDHRNDSDKRDRDKIYSSSQSRDRDRPPRDYRGSPRDNDHERGTDRERARDRTYKHDDSCRRSYGRSEDKEREDRKRPRTPPIMSPKRPKTPHEIVENTIETDRDPITEELHEKKGTKNAPEERDQQITAIVEESSKLDVEEFEPILSDEDILDDNDQFHDLSEEYNDIAENEELFRMFVPGSTDLISYIPSKHYTVTNTSIQITENLKIIIGICDDFFKSSITKYVADEFCKLNTEIKEEFIHLCEKLISVIGSVQNFILINEIHNEIRNVNTLEWNDVDKEIAEQIQYIFETTTDWLKIALDYELANSQDQAIYKIRHIKCGLKIAQFCFESDIFLNDLLKKNFNIFKVLLDLYKQEYMAPSIKLMILKALDISLIHKSSMEKFLNVKNENSVKQNGYSTENLKGNYIVLLEHLRHNTSVRLKFSLCSIIRKINLFEIFTEFQSVVLKLKSSESNVTTSEINLISKFLEEILQYLRNEQFTLTQPKRFLPVASQFDIVRENVKNILVKYFEMFNFVECIVFLLAHSLLSNLPIIKIPILEVISNLSETHDGLKYLASHSEAINILLKYLLQTDEEVQYSIQNGIDLKSHSLGILLSYKLKSYWHIACLLDIAPNFNYDLSSSEVLNELHGLFCLTLPAVGKIATASVLGMTDNFKCIAQFVNIKEKPENQLLKVKKSPGILYVIDLVHLVMMHSTNIHVMEKYNKEILHLLSYEGQQDVCSFKLNSIGSYMSPFVNRTLSYDNISPFVEIIQKEIDNVTERPEEIITSLRIIRYFGVSKYSNNFSITENPFSNYVELKYKHVILQLFSLDGVALITKILQRLCDHYKQPGLHSSSFMSQQGLLTIEIIQPCVMLLKQMLTYAIQCRNTNFKDLTAVPILLQSYNLLLSYPVDSPHYVKCSKVKENIAETLLVYTQPISEEIHEKDTLNKTLWSMMCKEVIQYISQAPFTFVSGLLVFSELLPLPLPIQTNEELEEKDTTWMINLRKLWAAHLHPHSSLIQEFVNKLCTTSNQSLLNLLRRICVQISDLAANSSLMISRGVLDAVCEEIIPKDNAKVACTPHLARLLNFLACLVTHSTLKCAVLSLLQANSVSQSDQKYVSLIPTFVQVLKINNQTNYYVQCQECILSIIQSFCDVEISLLQNPIELTSNIYISNALPMREHLIHFIEIISEHLSATNSYVTYLPAVRTILLLTEHDYGFYHLKENFIKKPGLFSALLENLSNNFSKDSPECVSVLNTVTEFFYVSVTIEEVVGPMSYSPRTMKFTVSEMKMLLGWKNAKSDKKEPLEVLKESLEGVAAEDATFEGLLEKFTALINLLNSEATSDSEERYSEPILPNPEPLLAQFTRRVVYNCTDTFNERLTAEYWLSVPNEETDSEVENVTVDLAEISKQNLPDDFNLIREIEILCRISSVAMTEKEKKSDDQKMKKPSFGPLRTRGFPRMVQQRPDLFRSRPPNTSRPPSLHVDDFVALETCGAQPTGPTGYNKISRELMSSRNPRGTRGRAFVASERAVQYRQMSWWGSGFGRLPY